MKHRLAILIFCLGLLLTTPEYSPQASAQAQSNPRAQVPAGEPTPVLAVPPGYHYEAHGRRDPFVNPIPKPPPGPKAVDPDAPPPRPAGPKGVSMEDIVLMGVVVAKDPAMTRAILQVPGLKAPMLVTVGESFYDAAIKEIRKDSVVFKMFPPGKKPSDATENLEVVKKLRSTAGEKK